ncbi:MAG: VanZ family protein [Anaerovoracaceae bacterium]
MARLINVGIQTMSAAIVLLPILIIENKLFFKNMKQTIYYIILGLYLASVYAVVGLPSINYIRINLTINAIPFIPMVADMKNSILNVILFIPYGIMLPFLWKKFSSLKSIMLFSFGTSLIIEMLQVFTYRATDINDLITNTTGAILGYLIFKILNKKLQLVPSNKGEKHFYVICATVFTVMFFIQPFIATTIGNFVY